MLLLQWAQLPGLAVQPPANGGRGCSRSPPCHWAGVGNLRMTPEQKTWVAEQSQEPAMSGHWACFSLSPLPLPVCVLTHKPMCVTRSLLLLHLLPQHSRLGNPHL